MVENHKKAARRSKVPALAHLGDRDKMSPVETYLYYRTGVRVLEQRLKEFIGTSYDLAPELYWSYIVTGKRVSLMGNPLLVGLLLVQTITRDGYLPALAIFQAYILSLLVQVASILIWKPVKYDVLSDHERLTVYRTTVFASAVLTAWLVLCYTVVYTIIRAIS